MKKKSKVTALNTRVLKNPGMAGAHAVFSLKHKRAARRADASERHHDAEWHRIQAHQHDTSGPAIVRKIARRLTRAVSCDKTKVVALNTRLMKPDHKATDGNTAFRFHRAAQHLSPGPKRDAFKQRATTHLRIAKAGRWLSGGRRTKAVALKRADGVIQKYHCLTSRVRRK